MKVHRDCKDGCILAQHDAATCLVECAMMADLDQIMDDPRRGQAAWINEMQRKPQGD